ncbi:MAG: hypothetical protein IPK58_12850 [Acidobacteria bacterium]|nr:hypothetical protein [Acidobacteriota bacterium]
MKNVVRNVIAFIAGLIALMIAKYVVTKIGGALIPPPAGVDLSTLEGFKAAMPLFETKHWVTPFMEHSAGSLAGGLVAALIAGSHKMKLALGMGALHLIGGITAAAMLPVPVWFSAPDLIVAYIPMAWIGGNLGDRS